MQSQMEARNRGFTLVELLMVIAITAVLAGVLLAVLSAARSGGQQSVCLDNLKQLAIGCHMYSADNDGRLVPNLPQSPPVETERLWVPGNLAHAADATNSALVRQGLIYPYLRDDASLHCPADLSLAQGLPRVRSYSMNGWFGSRYMEQTAAQSAYRTFVNSTELASVGPDELWMIADEHESTIDDAFFLVTMDDSRPFANFPAARHGLGFALAFGDGSVETSQLKDPETRERLQSAGEINPGNSDWNRLKQITTVPWNR
jgi:prepilin-type N-terminal cleavage/methylation domain-containing protein